MRTKFSRAFYRILIISFIISLPALMLIMQPVQSQDDSRGVKMHIKIKSGDGTLIDLYDESHALVIGVSEYTQGLPNLPGVVQDVTEISAMLRKHGFNVEVLMNPTRNTFDQALRTFIRKWGQTQGNRLLIYFAGHGHTMKTIDGRELGYIVPADTPLPTDVPSFKEIAISMDEIEVYARRVESKHVLFIFDSCFSGSLFEAMRTVPDTIGNKTALPVRQFITAGTAEQPVPDDSIFSKQLVMGLNGDADLNRDSFITGSELGMFLENSVTNYSRRTQTPRYGKIRDPKLDKGDFVFALPKPILPVITIDTFIKNGDRLKSEGKWAEAEMEYRRAIEVQQNSVILHAKLAAMLMAQKKYTEAEAEYRWIVLQESANALWHFNLGLALSEQGKYAQAEIEFREAVRIAPTNIQYKATLKQIIDKGSPQAQMTTNLPGNPIPRTDHLMSQPTFEQAKAYYNQGIDFLQSGDFRSAIRELDQAANIDPSRSSEYADLSHRAYSSIAEAHYRFGLDVFNQQNQQEAKAHFAQADNSIIKAINIASVRNNLDAMNLLAYYEILARNIFPYLLLHRDFNRVDAVNEALGKAESLDTNNKYKWSAYKADLFRFVGRSDEAVKLYKKILTDNQDNLDALFGLSLALTPSFQFDKLTTSTTIRTHQGQINAYRKNAKQALDYSSKFSSKAPATDLRLSIIKNLIVELKVLISTLDEMIKDYEAQISNEAYVPNDGVSKIISKSLDHHGQELSKIFLRLREINRQRIILEIDRQRVANRYMPSKF